MGGSCLSMPTMNSHSAIVSGIGDPSSPSSRSAVEPLTPLFGQSREEEVVMELTADSFDAGLDRRAVLTYVPSVSPGLGWPAFASEALMDDALALTAAASLMAV